MSVDLPSITVTIDGVQHQVHPTAYEVEYLENNVSIKRDANATRWFKGQYLHREDGPAIIDAGGGSSWFINGEYHRDDGPAIDHPYIKCWYVDGKMHRLDGPAKIVSSNYQYGIHGTEYEMIVAEYWNG